MAASLVSEAMTIFAKTKDALPCSRLALTAHEFSGLVSGRGSIASFLRVLPPPVESPSPEAVKSVPKATLALDPSRRRGGDISLPELVVSGVGGEQNDVSNRGRGEVTTDPQGVRNFSGEPGSSSGNGSDAGGGGGDAGGGGGDSGSVWGSDTRRSHPAGDESEKPPSSPLRPGDNVCPKCEKMLAEEEDLQEHLDFHYAEGLQERYAREGGVAQGMASTMSNRGEVSKRRRQEPGGKRAKSQTKRPAGQRIDSFFKPT